MAHRPKYVFPAYKANPLSAIAAGKAGEPQTITSVGGTDAGVSKLLFAGIFVAGDLFVIGGITFTAMTSGATGNYQFNITGVLSTDLDNLITKLSAAPDPRVSMFTYTKTDTNTSVSATPKLGTGANGNTVAGDFSSTHSTTTPTRQTGGVAAPVISLDTRLTTINNATGGKYTLGAFPDFIPAGFEADEDQDKRVVNLGAGAAVVVGDMQGGVQISLAQNQACSLQYLGGKWRPVYNTGTLS
jgi:hypothetical protein